MDRNAPISIVAAIAISIVGVFALMTQPMIIGIYAEALQFTEQQGNFIVIAEIAGGALASILAMFWIGKVNWRVAIVFALSVVIIGKFNYDNTYRCQCNYRHKICSRVSRSGHSIRYRYFYGGHYQ